MILEPKILFSNLITVDLIMTARMNVTKPTLRKSTLALHRMKSKDHEGFEEVRVFVKQVSSNSALASIINLPVVKFNILMPVLTCKYQVL